MTDFEKWWEDNAPIGYTEKAIAEFAWNAATEAMHKKIRETAIVVMRSEPLAPEGYVVIKAEPTDEMLERFYEEFTGGSVIDAYNAIISAAQGID